MSTEHASERMATLSPAKQALLAKLLRGEGRASAPAADAIPRRDPGAPAPLSGAQQRLWFLHWMDPAGAAFNIPLVLRLRGTPDVDTLERALAEIVRRHQALRTVFPSHGGTPVQEILPVPAPVLRRETLPAVADHEREDAVRAWVAAEANAPFDLAAEPGFRARLLRVGDNEHVLSVGLHHIASDGWSSGILYRELAALYGAFARGEPSPLAEPPIQYADYAAWQRARLAGPEHARQVDFWRARLAGAPVLLDLPTDRPRPAVQSTAGAAHRFHIPRGVYDRLAAVAGAEGATPFMALAAAWSALLHRWSGEDDVVVGTPLAGRTHPSTGALIGFFVQTMALRMDLSGDPTFRALLGRVRRTTVDAYAHPDVPFDQLVDELKVERSLSHPPLFQAMITLQNGVGLGADSGLPGVRVQRISPEMRSGEGYLLLHVEESPLGLEATIEYPSDLWHAATIERMEGHLRMLLDAAAADPDVPLSRLPLLSDEERARLIAEGAGPVVTTAELPAHRRFESEARRTPEAVAVEAEDGTLTYRELDRRANQLAHHLRARGVGPETLVALCVERGAQMLVSLLAILKAGGAYLPVDPAYPADRIAWMLGDSGARFVVTQAALLDLLPLEGIDAVAVNRDAEGIAARPTAPPGLPYSLYPLPCRPDAVAYVIYTSGSTGRPKGVMVRHGALANFIRSMARAPGLRRDGVLVAVTTLSFDIAALELLLPLAVGARVRIVSREAAADPVRLRALLADATAVQATPATWRMLLDAGWTPPADLAVFCGGEALPRELAQRLMADGAPLWNLYGPTETTIWSAALRVEPGDGPVPVGGAIDNTQLYVLDAGLQPAPLGVFGELYVGGEGLARGYLRRPGLTADRFVPHPFATKPGERLYRTGDRARRLADGTLEISGRLDTQVKLRGFRIELGEIEAVLQRHPLVREAATSVRDDAHGGARLVAYVVAADAAAPPSPAELRAFLGDTLPEYMLPSVFVPMEALPLTPSGKVDRRALPAPTPPPEHDFVPPATPAEKTIASFWAEALGIDRVSIHDNFFEIGGHSLLVARVHARIREAFARDVTLVDLFRHATIATQAAFVTAGEHPTDAAQQPGTPRAETRRAS